MNQDKKLGKIKSSVFSRSFALAKLTLGTSSSLASHGLGNLFSSEEQKETRWNEFLKERAGVMSQELGELKGSVMKAGQLLSMYGEHFLPKDVNDLLKSLQFQSPPLAWEAIEQELLTHLGPAKLSELEIEKESIGSASLGQVHKAKIRATGEWIALKVQYPGVERAIESDLKALKSILSLTKILPRDFKTDHLFDEIKDMLLQEVDYQKEALATEDYRERLSQDPRFVVPRVYFQYSGAKVLATSFEVGVPADDPLVLSLAKARRNRLAHSFIDLYFQELFQWGVVQTDPHLGNYKVRIDPRGEDKLVLLDFGAVRKYPEEFLNPYHAMIKAAVLKDRDGLQAAAKKLSFVREGDPPELVQIFEDFCLATVEPFLQKDDPRVDKNLLNSAGEYNWKKSDLPQRLSKMVFSIIGKYKARTPPREIMFLDRKTGGVFIFLSVLGAELDGASLITPYLLNRQNVT